MLPITAIAAAARPLVIEGAKLGAVVLTAYATVALGAVAAIGAVNGAKAATRGAKALWAKATTPAASAAAPLAVPANTQEPAAAAA